MSLIVRVNGRVATDWNDEPYLFSSYPEAEEFIRVIRQSNCYYVIEQMED